MKRAFIFSFIYLFLNYFSFANKLETKGDSTRNTNLIIKTDILLPIITASKYHTAEFSFTVERPFNKRHSFQLTIASFGNNKGNYTSQSIVVKTVDQYTNHSMAIIPEYKFFVSKKRNYTGYYLGASIAYILNAQKNAWSEYIPAGVSYNNTLGPATLYSHNQENANGLAVGIINGFQYDVSEHLVLDFIAGGGIGWDMDTQGFNSSQFVWRLALNVGYKF